MSGNSVIIMGSTFADNSMVCCVIDVGVVAIVIIIVVICIIVCRDFTRFPKFEGRLVTQQVNAM